MFFCFQQATLDLFLFKQEMEACYGVPSSFPGPNLTEVFQKYDADGKGHLNFSDLKVAWIFLFGYKPSSHEVMRLVCTGTTTINKEKRHSEIRIDLPTFKRLMMKRLADNVEHQEIRQLFYAFDVKCHGFLTLDDLKCAFKIVAPKIPESSVVACFHSVCSNSHGKISYREFEAVMQSCMSL